MLQTSLVVGTFTGVKYVVNLTDTINKNQSAITIINEKDLKNQTVKEVYWCPRGKPPGI